MIPSWVDIEWATFECLPPDLLRPPRELDREEAWRRHRKRLAVMPERLEVIHELLAVNGVEVGSRGDRALEILDAWLHDRAMAHGTELWNVESPFLSLVHDVGALYGDELIARYPNLHWTLRRGAPTNIVNHHTVVAGYTRTKRKTYSEEVVFGYIRWLKAEFEGAAYRPVWMPLLKTADGFA